MNVQATLNGETVNIVDVDINGLDVQITYVDASGYLTVTKKTVNRADFSTVIATSATIV